MIDSNLAKPDSWPNYTHTQAEIEWKWNKQDKYYHCSIICLATSINVVFINCWFQHCGSPISPIAMETADPGSSPEQATWMGSTVHSLLINQLVCYWSYCSLVQSHRHVLIGLYQHRRPYPCCVFQCDITGKVWYLYWNPFKCVNIPMNRQWDNKIFDTLWLIW